MSQRKNDILIQRLKSKYAIDALFTKGTSLSSKHLLLRLNKSIEGNTFYAGVSVSKRNFKRAVDRNHIKRQLRIALKSQEKRIIFPGHGMLIFKGRKKVSTLILIKEAQAILEKI